MNNQYTIRFKPEGKLLEVGGGERPMIRPNIDVREGITVDIVWDVSTFPWPIESKSLDGVFSQYAIEHIEWKHVESFIKELYRILKPGGKAIIITANLYEQCKKVVEEGVNKGTVEMIFGSQEFENFGGCHKCGFSTAYAEKVFKDAGFNFIKTLPHPATITDLIIEVYKMNENNIFEREYFEEGTIGYKQYRDFSQHYATARKIKEMFPDMTSLLELGCARGYVIRILENQGIKAEGMDVSKHCMQTRATNKFILHDITDVPWHLAKIYKDKEFDVTFSINVLEHIPEEHIDKVIRELARVSKRGLHGIHYTDAPYEESPDVDITHRTMHPKSWWIDKFKTIAPDYPVTILYPRELENDDVELCIAVPPETKDELMKLNLGSFTDMFYYGWINIDIIDLNQFAESQGYLFNPVDVTKGLPYKDNTIDLIMSNHLIEHLSRDEGKAFLKECARVLKSKGIIRISTPDAEKLTTEYLNGEIWQYKVINTGVEQAKDKAQAFHELLMSGHKTIYDQQALDNILKEAGFQLLPKVNPFTSNSDTIQKQTLTTHCSLSAVIEAEKP